MDSEFIVVYLLRIASNKLLYSMIP